MCILQIIIGLILLFVGSESLIRGSVNIAKRFNISTLVIGLTVVAVGTSTPELAININSALKGSHAIAFGNVVGSNILNVVFVIALAALIYPIKVPSKFSKLDMSFLLIGNAVVYVIAFFGIIERTAGVLMLVLLVTYLSIIVKNALKYKEKKEDQMETTCIDIKRSCFFILFGSVLLAFGGHILTEGAIIMAQIIGISEAVIGVTIVAIGSSAPEMVTTIVASIKKQSDIAIGGIAGSNLFNILGILGITAIIKPLEVQSSFLRLDLPFALATTLMLYFVIRFSKVIDRRIGGIFLCCYFLYLYLQFILC